MTKNVIVLDKFDNEIGLTYPKRAKGLVKNGRAECAGDCKIRMLNTHAPTDQNDSEVNIMSNVINFNAREFKFDNTCESNAGSRLFITDNFGENVEIYEIGNWGWSWTQILCEKKLEKNTDYIFRFAMTGGYCDTQDETSQFIICPIPDGENLNSAWNDRYTYSLAHSAYAPALSKRWNSEIMRVYEIPFNTGNCELVRFVFIAMHAVARLFPAKELAAYADFEDLSYNEWWQERSKQLGMGRGQFPNGFPDFMKSMFSNSMGSGDCNVPNATESDGSMLVFSNRNFSEREFAKGFESCGGGCSLSFTNCNVCSDGSSELYGIGENLDGGHFEFLNCNITSKAWSMLVRKIGDGCFISFENCTVTGAGIDNMYLENGSTDGCVINFSNCNIPAKPMSILINKIGDGCVTSLDNCTVTAAGLTDLYPVGTKADGAVFNFTNTTLPQEITDLIDSKKGDGCCVDMSNTLI